MAELADALHSGCSELTLVQVRFLFWARRRYGGEDKFFALVDECPHKKGPLSEGIVSGNTITCPLHNWVIGLDTGIAAEPDEGRTQTVPVKMENGELYIGLELERAA